MLVKSLKIAILLLVLLDFPCIFTRSIEMRTQCTPDPLQSTTESVNVHTVFHNQDDAKVNNNDIDMKNGVPMMVNEIDTKRINQKSNKISRTTRAPTEPVVRSGSIGEYNLVN